MKAELQAARPTLYARYRFYVRGRVPRGYEEWAKRSMGLPRWTAIYFVLNTVVIAVTGLLVWLLARDRFVINVVIVTVVGMELVLTPLSAAQARRRARESLRPQVSARTVLAEIGEPVR